MAESAEVRGQYEALLHPTAAANAPEITPLFVNVNVVLSSEYTSQDIRIFVIQSVKVLRQIDKGGWSSLYFLQLANREYHACGSAELSKSALRCWKTSCPRRAFRRVSGTRASFSCGIEKLSVSLALVYVNGGKFVPMHWFLTITGDPWQARLPSHDVVPDGEGDSVFLSLCSSTSAPEESVSGTRLLWLTLFKEACFTKICNVHFVAGRKLFRHRDFWIRSIFFDIGLRRLIPWIFAVADVPTAILGADFLAAFDLLVDRRQLCLYDRASTHSVNGFHQSHLSTVYLYLTQTLTVNSQFGVTLHPVKCVLGATSLESIGHQIDSDAIRLLPSKVAAFRDFSFPTSKRQLQRFLGMVIFYRRLDPNLADTILPLTSLLAGSKCSFKLTSAALTSFEQVKALLADAPLSLMAEASNVAVGAVLQQRPPDPTVPLAFFSRKLSRAETRYSTFGSCTRIPTTVYYLTANRMVERCFRQLKTSLRAADDSENWTDHLPQVLLGIHSALKPNLDCSAAERVFDAAVRLSGEMIPPNPRGAVEDPTNLLQRLQQFTRTLSSAPPRSSASPS
ncbi:hypothetical protein SprV_0200880200 [Sparganum proliferum]